MYVLGRVSLMGYIGSLPELVHLVAYRHLDHPIPPGGQSESNDPTRTLENYHEPWWKSPMKSEMVPWADQPAQHLLIYRSQVMF